MKSKAKILSLLLVLALLVVGLVIGIAAADGDGAEVPDGYVEYTDELNGITALNSSLSGAKYLIYSTSGAFTEDIKDGYIDGTGANAYTNDFAFGSETKNSNIYVYFLSDVSYDAGSSNSIDYNSIKNITFDFGNHTLNLSHKTFVIGPYADGDNAKNGSEMTFRNGTWQFSAAVQWFTFRAGSSAIFENIVFEELSTSKGGDWTQDGGANKVVLKDCTFNIPTKLYTILNRRGSAGNGEYTAATDTAPEVINKATSVYEISNVTVNNTKPSGSVNFYVQNPSGAYYDKHIINVSGNNSFSINTNFLLNESKNLDNNSHCDLEINVKDGTVFDGDQTTVINNFIGNSEKFEKLALNYIDSDGKVHNDAHVVKSGDYYVIAPLSIVKTDINGNVTKHYGKQADYDTLVRNTKALVFYSDVEYVSSTDQRLTFNSGADIDLNEFTLTLTKDNKSVKRFISPTNEGVTVTIHDGKIVFSGDNLVYGSGGKGNIYFVNVDITGTSSSTMMDIRSGVTKFFGGSINIGGLFAAMGGSTSEGETPMSVQLYGTKLNTSSNLVNASPNPYPFVHSSGQTFLSIAQLDVKIARYDEEGNDWGTPSVTCTDYLINYGPLTDRHPDVSFKLVVEDAEISAKALFNNYNQNVNMYDPDTTDDKTYPAIGSFNNTVSFSNTKLSSWNTDKLFGKDIVIPEGQKVKAIDPETIEGVTYNYYVGEFYDVTWNYIGEDGNETSVTEDKWYRGTVPFKNDASRGNFVGEDGLAYRGAVSTWVDENGNAPAPLTGDVSYTASAYSNELALVAVFDNATNMNIVTAYFDDTFASSMITSAAEGSYIKIQKSVNSSGTLSLAKNLTIDLCQNDYTLVNHGFLIPAAGKTVTVKNGTVQNPQARRLVHNGGGTGKLIFDGVDVVHVGFGSLLYFDNGHLEFKNCTIDASQQTNNVFLGVTLKAGTDKDNLNEGSFTLDTVVLKGAPKNQNGADLFYQFILTHPNNYSHLTINLINTTLDSNVDSVVGYRNNGYTDKESDDWKNATDTYLTVNANGLKYFGANFLNATALANLKDASWFNMSVRDTYLKGSLYGTFTPAAGTVDLGNQAVMPVRGVTGLNNVIAEPTQTPIKTNLSLYSDFTLNLYVPVESNILSINDYEYVVDEETGEKVVVEIDGNDYYVMSIEGIAPTEATEKIPLVIKFTYTNEDNVVETRTLSAKYSAINYAKDYLRGQNADNAEGTALVKDTLAYIKAATLLKTPGADVSSVTALIGDDYVSANKLTKTDKEFATNDYISSATFDIEGTITRLRLTLKNADTVITANGAECYVEDGYCYVELRAFMLAGEVNIYADGVLVGAYSLQMYASSEAFDGNADNGEATDAQKALVDALYGYAVSAKAYRNTPDIMCKNGQHSDAQGDYVCDNCGAVMGTWDDVQTDYSTAIAPFEKGENN